MSYVCVRVTFPWNGKESILFQFRKKGDNEAVKNYRSISL